MLKHRIASVLLLLSTYLMGQKTSDRSMVWQGQRFNTTEYFTVSTGKTIVLNGSITGEAYGLPVDLSYTIEADQKWNVLAVKLLKRAKPSKEIMLRKDVSSNKWIDQQGNYLSEIEGCADVDFSLTPSTNSLPINRLKFTPGAAYEIKVVYIDLLTFEIRPVQQKYSYLKNNVYRYESISSGFKADIKTDEQGFVIDYPGIWHRVYPANPRYNQRREFADALISDSYSSELNGEEAMYDWLIGSWEVTAFDYSDNSTIETKGEWIFSWVLEGRAVQDVWIAPQRSLRTTQSPRNVNRYGTSLRVFHPDTKKWKVYWHNPVSGTDNQMTASKHGKDIVQEGQTANGNPLRWIFTDISNDAFRWYGEYSADEGKTWKLATEFYGRKRK
jgi:hypothetical protein